MSSWWVSGQKLALRTVVTLPNASQPYAVTPPSASVTAVLRFAWSNWKLV
jgi:hypothetical protein